MVLVIMYRHFRKQQKKSEIAKAWYESSSYPVPFSPLFHLYLLYLFLVHLLLLLFHLTCRHWIKVTLTLVVVIGIAWIANILFFDVNLLFNSLPTSWPFSLLVRESSSSSCLYHCLNRSENQMHLFHLMVLSVLMCVGEAGIPQVVEQQSISVFISH